MTTTITTAAEALAESIVTGGVTRADVLALRVVVEDALRGVRIADGFDDALDVWRTEDAPAQPTPAPVDADAVERAAWAAYPTEHVGYSQPVPDGCTCDECDRTENRRDAFVVGYRAALAAARAAGDGAGVDREALTEQIDGVLSRCQIDGVDPAPDVADLLARRIARGDAAVPSVTEWAVKVDGEIVTRRDRGSKIRTEAGARQAVTQDWAPGVARVVQREVTAWREVTP